MSALVPPQQESWEDHLPQKPQVWARHDKIRLIHIVASNSGVPSSFLPSCERYQPIPFLRETRDCGAIPS